jgi:hypothetical protein
MRYLLMIMILILGALLLCSCSTGSSGPGLVSAAGSTTSTPGATIMRSSLQGANAASQTAQTRDLLITNTQLFKNLGDIAQPLMTPVLINQNMDITCTDGGTFQYSGTSDGVISNLTFTFNGCRDKGYQYVGSYALSGTPSNFTITLGGSSTFNIFNFNPSYTVLLAYLKANLRFNMVGSGDQTDASFTITSNGTMTTFDYFLLDTFAMVFSNLKADYALSTDSVTKEQTISITSNGQLRETWGRSYMIGLKLTDFKIDKVRGFDVNSNSYYADDTRLNGTVAFSVRPSTFGIGGTFTVDTQAPVRTVYASPRHTTQGTIILNTNSTVQYNASGDLDVTVTGDVPLHYDKEYELMKLSDFAAMEQDKPPLITPPGPGAPISLPTGSTMAVTLTWTGPAPSFVSTSDMDLHVKFYNMPNPTLSDIETWHMDWHQGKTYPGSTGSCADPLGISFGDAIDLDDNHTGTCDVGLDFDDTTGYGPEHITALKIPAGYYVVSVNSFSLNPSEYPTTLYLSLHVGDSIFGPYTGTLSDSDGEGVNTAAWFRVADVRVNADGSIDILAPDPSLNPWHDL